MRFSNILLSLLLFTLFLSLTLCTDDSSSCSPKHNGEQERRGMERGMGGGRSRIDKTEEKGKNGKKKGGQGEKLTEEEIEKKAASLELVVFSAVTRGERGRDGRERFMKSAQAFGVSVVEIIFDEKEGIDCSSLALPRFSSYLNHNNDPSSFSSFSLSRDSNKIVLFLFGEHSILLDNPKNLIKKFLEVGGDVVFGGERICWPDKKLEGRYPEGEGKKFLYGSIFMGYAPAITELLSQKKFDLSSSTPRTQLFFSLLYLTPSRHLSFTITIDSSSTLFYTLLDDPLDVSSSSLSLTHDPSSHLGGIFVKGSNTTPGVVTSHRHTKNFDQKMINNIGNYVAKGWDPEIGCQQCRKRGGGGEREGEEELKGVMVGVFLSEGRVGSLIESVVSQNYPPSNIDLIINLPYNDPHTQEVFSEIFSPYEPLYHSVQRRLVDFSYTNGYPGKNKGRKKENADENVILGRDARNSAVRECHQSKKCDYYIYISSGVVLESRNVFSEMISENRSIVTPLLRSSLGEVNFGVGEEKQGVGLLDDFLAICFAWNGVWNVPAVGWMVGVEGRVMGEMVGGWGGKGGERGVGEELGKWGRERGLFLWILGDRKFGRLVGGEKGEVGGWKWQGSLKQVKEFHGEIEIQKKERRHIYNKNRASTCKPIVNPPVGPLPPLHSLSLLYVSHSPSPTPSDGLTRSLFSSNSFNISSHILSPPPSPSPSPPSPLDELSLLLSYLRPHQHNPNFVVLFTSSPHQLTFLSTPSDILSSFLSFNTHILFPSHLTCSPLSHLPLYPPPPPSHKPFLSSSSFMGFASSLYTLLDSYALPLLLSPPASLFPSPPSLQHVLSLLYLTPSLRPSLSLSLDSSSSLFLSLTHSFLDTKILSIPFPVSPPPFLYSPSHSPTLRYLFYEPTNSTPSIILNDHPNPLLYNSLYNSLGIFHSNSRNLAESSLPPSALPPSPDTPFKRPKNIEIGTRSKITTPTASYPLISAFIFHIFPEHGNMKLCLKYFGKQNYPKSRVQLVVTVPVGESRPFEEAQDFVKKYGSEYYSAMVQIDDFSVKRGLGGKRGRGVGERGAGEVLEGGVRRCEENEECEVFFLVYTHVLLREIDTVRSVLLANRTLVAPLVKDRTNTYSNYWLDLTADGLPPPQCPTKASLDDLKVTGLFHVPFVTDVFALQRKGFPHLKVGESYWMGTDPLVDMFRGSRTGAGIFPYLLNLKVFGVVVKGEGEWLAGGKGGEGVMFQFPSRGERDLEEDRRREREMAWKKEGDMDKRGYEGEMKGARGDMWWEREELGEWGRCAPRKKIPPHHHQQQHPFQWLWEGVDLYVIEMTDRAGIVAKKGAKYGIKQGITSVPAVTPLTSLDGLGEFANLKASDCVEATTPTVIAISLSHLKALKTACDRSNRSDVAVVMEDDVNFEPVRYWPESLRGMVSTLASGWKVINGGVTNSNLFEGFGKEEWRRKGWGGEQRGGKKSYFREWRREDWGAQFVVYNLSHPNVCGRLQNVSIQDIWDNSQAECEVADMFIYREIGGGERGEGHSELTGWGAGVEADKGVYSAKLPLVFFSDEAEDTPTGAFNVHPTIQAYYHRRAWSSYRTKTLLECLEMTGVRKIVTRWDEGFGEAVGERRCGSVWELGKEGWSGGRKRERERECVLVVVSVESVEEVQEAMVCASQSVISVTTKSLWDWDCMTQMGTCEGQMILDVSGLDSFSVATRDDPQQQQQQQQIVNFGTGYSTGELTTILTQNKLFLPMGRDPLEGVRREWVKGSCGGGWGGGWVGGWCDVIVGVEWVDAEGRVRNAGVGENEDLFSMFMGGKKGEMVRGGERREFPGVVTKISAVASPHPHSITQFWCQYDRKYEKEVVEVWVSHVERGEGRGRGVVEVGVVKGERREGWIELRGWCFGCKKGNRGELELFEQMVGRMKSEIEKKIKEKSKKEDALNEKEAASLTTCQQRTTSLLDSFLTPLPTKSTLNSAKIPLKKREDLLKTREEIVPGRLQNIASSSGSRLIQGYDHFFDIWEVVRRELEGMPGGRVGEVVLFPWKERGDWGVYWEFEGEWGGKDVVGYSLLFGEKVDEVLGREGGRGVEEGREMIWDREDPDELFFRRG